MPRLEPNGGVPVVRMYRQGHGDCFLLALPREGGGEPVYVLVDCGFKPGSQAFVGEATIADVIADIGESTGDRLDLVVITHEHQDHVNGFWKEREPYFGRFEIGEAWLAWTEDPADELANELRRRHGDALLGLLGARSRLALAFGETDPALLRLDALLELEWGGEETGGSAAAALAAAEPGKSKNKQAMRLVKEQARRNRGVRYLRPGDGPLSVPAAAGVRAYVLGPPRSADLLRDENPAGSEAFPGDRGHGLSFHAAVEPGRVAAAPFGPRHCISLESALDNPFFARRYGREGAGDDDRDAVEVPPDATWRRVDDEWLHSAESLALALNRGVNNTSLVLAFELAASGKVLLFVGDAQRGSWVSWTSCRWRDGRRTVTARDLLARTVLYKVGHHGSHNATLAGSADDPHPNLEWMGRGRYASEFTAMITAVREWALTRNRPPWNHPLPAIRSALRRKAQGRVFQTDEARPEKPKEVAEEVWERFIARARFEELYFEYSIPDE